MFLSLNPLQRNKYGNLLGLMGSLSRLFSDNETVYLDYRVVENLFCRSFDAKNVSRSDVAVDAILGQMGIGIKTFTLGNKNTYSYEKIAEFSRKDLQLAQSNKALIQQIATIRNERLAFAQRTYGIQELFYHCVTRRQSFIQVFEFNLHPINLAQITIQNTKDNAIFFDDGLNDYLFRLSKSTAYLKFNCVNPLLESEVKILQDPFDLLEQFLHEQAGYGAVVYPTAYLPLYSENKAGKFVPEKSGLNHWNAGGRPRNLDEVYIPVRRKFHHIMPDFFPPRDTHFTLHLPNGDKMSAKLCQQDSKALMSNPNGTLGDWLLRHVLNLKEGELLTYDYLLKLGIDSLIFQKIDDLEYTIDFAPIGAYEQFIHEQEI